MSEQIAAQLGKMLYITLIVSAPALIVAAIVGFVVALFQAVTQIQDQSLPQTAKIIAVALTLLIFGGALIVPLVNYSNDIFLNFYSYAR